MGFFAVDYKFVTNKPSLKGKVAQRSCDGRLKALKNVFYLAKFEKSKSLYYNFFPKNAIYCVLIKVSLEPFQRLIGFGATLQGLKKEKDFGLVVSEVFLVEQLR